MKARAIASAPTTTRTKQQLRLWLRILRTTRGIEAELRERLRLEFNTTMPRFDVMAALARTPTGLSMTALSRTLIVSNGNVTGIVDRLVTDGLVVRLSSAQDRRTTFVRLTREGEKMFAEMAAVHERWIGELLGPLDTRGAADMTSLLDRLAPQTLTSET
jgi:DNA-binding MarR family transcriptional regulator